MDTIAAGTVQVFYSYAHEDENLLHQLDRHLSPLKKEQKIASWHDRDIQAGSNWKQDTDEHINTADIILLLISSDFMSSDYHDSVEMKRALERHRAGEARIIPIILRPVDWQHSPLGQLKALPRDGKPVTSYTDQDEACLEIAQGIRQVVNEMFEKHSFQRHHNQRVWTVPYDRNIFFTGRENILQEIRNVFTAGKNVALSGIGGVGKTQTALAYAYRHRNEYQTVLWARADPRELLITDLAAFADPLKIVGQRAEDQVYALTAVKQWLLNNTNWLLIIDNVEDVKTLYDLLPTGTKGHILCTTQAQATRTFHRIDLKEMGLEEGATFLLQRSRLFPSDLSAEGIPADEMEAARTIVQLTGGLPLALDQAGAYIDEAGYNSLDDYRATYQQQETRLLELRSDDSTGHSSSVTTTFSLALEKIKQASEVAAELLSFYAFLHPDAIPDDIIAQGDASLGVLLSALTTDRISRDKARSILRHYSLIRGNPIDKTFSMHRLIQVIVKDNMPPETQRSWAERVVRVVNTAFPDVEFSTWQRCQRYIAQVQLCATYIEQWNFTFPEAARLLNEAGYYLYEVAQYVDAESLLTHARLIREQTSEENRLDLATTLNHLAELYKLQGRYAEAEPLYQQSLVIRERQLGPDHPETATSLNNLANLYLEQAKYSAAESLFLRSLKIREQQLGATHTDFASSLHNLARLYQAHGKYVEAEPLYQQALEIKEKQLGGEHPETATALGSLAGLYQAQGKYVKAEPFYQRALAIKEKQLGGEHPDTAAALGNLASLYRVRGKYAEAEPLYQRTLEIAEKQLGREHPNTAAALGNLATLYWNQGKYVEAERLYRRSLEINEKQLGGEHPNTAIALGNLAGSYQDQGKYVEAERLHRRALEIDEKQLGGEHPNTATALGDLARLYQAQGKYAEAEPLYQRALEINEKQLGGEHPATAAALHNLARLYQAQGKYIQAKLKYERALKINEKQLGSKHPKVAYVLDGLATLYHVQGNWKQAEPLYQRAVKICEQALGEEHPDTIRFLEHYAQFLNDAKSKRKAEEVEIRIEIIKTNRAEKEEKSS